MNKTFLQRVLILFIGMYALSGCIKSDLSHCVRKGDLVVRVLGHNGQDITHTGESGDVWLFVYDDNDKLLGREFLTAAEVQAKKTLPVLLEKGVAQRYIAWSNIVDTVKMMSFAPERALAENKITPLLDAEGYASFPADIFYGHKRVSEEELKASVVQELEILRALSQIHVSVVGMPPGTVAEGYSIVIANDDQAALTFENQVIRAAGMKYRQPAAWLQTNKMMGTKQAFRTLPSPPGTSKAVMLYKGDELIASASQDVEGKPIAPKAGERVNVLIDLNKDCDCSEDTGVLEVRVVVSDWNQVVEWKVW